jgi:hypothetical protein
MSRYQLAQLNIAELRAPLDSPELKDFVDNLDRINALAEGSTGFVWRLMGDGNDATSLRPMGENIIVNMSVWKNVVSLRDFVYKSAHVAILRRKREWFTRMAEAYMCLWWVNRSPSSKRSPRLMRSRRARRFPSRTSARRSQGRFGTRPLARISSSSFRCCSRCCFAAAASAWKRGSWRRCAYSGSSSAVYHQRANRWFRWLSASSVNARESSPRRT